MTSLIFFSLLLCIFVNSLAQTDSARLYLNKDFEAVENIKDAFIFRDALIRNNRYFISDLRRSADHTSKVSPLRQ